MGHHQFYALVERGRGYTCAVSAGVHSADTSGALAHTHAVTAEGTPNGRSGLCASTIEPADLLLRRLRVGNVDTRNE